jgi:hypothetical protein
MRLSDETLTRRVSVYLVSAYLLVDCPSYFGFSRSRLLSEIETDDSQDLIWEIIEEMQFVLATNYP